MLGYTLFERNVQGDDFSHEMTTGYIAQSFTPGTAHKVHQFRFKCLRIGASGVATISLYATDANGKPTGTALATCTVAQADISTAAFGWIGGELSTAYETVSNKLIVVLHSAASGLWCRYQSVGQYSSGQAWSSTDGVTWTSYAPYDFVFEEWGEPLPLYGTYKLPFYPTAKGTHTELFNEEGRV